MKTQIVYKLTDQRLQTHGGYQWALGETRTFPGTGRLCTDGWAHAYTHPLLAILLNPMHANYSKPRLFQAEGIVGVTDHDLKVGCSTLRLVCELPLPAVTIEQRVRFALRCALAVYREAKFVGWAEQWLRGETRSAEAARAAAAEVWAAEAAAWVAEAAVGMVNLVDIAEAACADLEKTT